MAITQVVFADVSELKIKGTAFEGVVSAQVNSPAEVRPFYGWGSALPRVKVTAPTVGSGSFTYISGLPTAADYDFKTDLDGTVDATITIVGGTTKGNAEVQENVQEIELTKCLYTGKSFGMNARGEGTVTVNFSFDNGMNP